jgi:hypothetical protein
MDETTEYRCEEIKKSGQVMIEVTSVPFNTAESRLLISENPDHQPHENEPFRKDMHLKILCFSDGA